MIYVALCALLVAIVSVVSSAGLLRSQQRQHGRERDLLLDRLMHLADKTWTPPPADDWQPPAVPDEPGRYVTSGSLTAEDF